MATMTIDLSDVKGSIANFPNGVYEAKVLDAELDVAASSGNPLIKLTWEVHHPQLGNANLFDNLPYGFPAKVKAFWLAANDWTEEDFRAHVADNGGEVELNPEEMVGAIMLIQIGEREWEGKTRKQVSGAWYFPASRTDLLELDESDTPF